jgi:D-alanyl-lipoteichoic acid acyltransferase DltB (MBOAT superfamily)
MGSAPFVLGGLSLCSWLVGAIAAAVWKKRFCFAWRWGIILAIASFLVVLLGSVFIEALPLLKPWLTPTERFIAHTLFSLLPSQVAFWGFSGVMRIGWKSRLVGS